MSNSSAFSFVHDLPFWTFHTIVARAVVSDFFVEDSVEFSLVPLNYTVGGIIQFFLVDTINGTEIPLAAGPNNVSGSFSIRADIGGGDKVGSVKFVLEREALRKFRTTDSSAPYQLFEDDLGNVTSHPKHFVTNRTYTLTATPYSEPEKGGVRGISSDISFTFL